MGIKFKEGKVENSKMIDLSTYSRLRELVFGRDAINFWFFALLHILSAVGIFYVPCSWSMIGVFMLSYSIRGFAITGGYHRYFSHRSYSTSRVFQFILAFLGASSIQKGPLWWASHHRHHHKYADHEEDIHSPVLRGFIWSHIGWFLFSEAYADTRWKYIPDLVRYPELCWINQYHIVPGIIYASAFAIFGGFQAFFWGFLVNTVILWHVTFFINSLAHVFGWRRYATDDTSRNNWMLALITCGEGWHNNHHAFKASANQGFFWWEIDTTYYILRILSFFVVVWDLKKPALDKLEPLLISQEVKDHFLDQLIQTQTSSKKKIDRSHL